MLKRFAAAAGVLAALLVASPAYATGPIPVESDCNSGWYVNPDEGALLPEQTEDGFLLDGPSIVHRTVTAVKLADAPAGSLNAVDVTGTSPLFKAETGAPYSTINVTADGKVWSSKIPTGPGSQDSPVASIAALAPLSPYTADTEVKTIGGGYANDTGNKATVTSITWGATTYELDCKPASPSPSATPSATATNNPPATGEPTAPPAADELPLTGAGTAALFGIGAAVLLAGVGAVVLFRSRRRFEA